MGYRSEKKEGEGNGQEASVWGPEGIFQGVEGKHGAGTSGRMRKAVGTERCTLRNTDSDYVSLYDA